MKKITTLLLVMHACIASAQPFQKKYGGTASDFATSIIHTTDGGTLAVGDTYSFGAGQSDMILVKMDAAGNVQWTKTLGNTDYDHANDVVQTSDGGYAIAGSSGGNTARIALAKFTATGDVQWIKYYSANTRQSAAALVQTPDGGFAVAGQVSTYNNGSQGYVLRTDSLGIPIWSKYVFARNFYPELRDIILTNDGGFAVAGHAIEAVTYNQDMYLVKLSAAGAFQWARSIGGASTELPTFVKQTGDGGYLMGGYTFSYAKAQDMMVVKTSGTGAFEWSKVIGTMRNESAEDATEIPGGVVIMGGTDSSAGNYRQPMMVRLRNNGTPLGAKILTLTGNASILSTTPYESNGFRIAGYTGSYFDIGQDIYVARFNAKGNTCGSFGSYGSVQDTGLFLTQTVPVTNVAVGYSAGSEKSVAQTIAVTDLCPSFAATAATPDAIVAAPKTNTGISPNPATGLAYLQYTADNESNISIRISAIDGKLLFTRTYVVTRGSNRLQLPIQQLQKGMYLVQVITKGGSETLRLMKQ